MQITYEDFDKVDIRLGKIVAIEDAIGLKKPSYKMTIDFGSEIGHKISLGQYVANYSKDELLGKLVMGVVNFAPKQIGHYTSESLTLGFYDENGNAILAIPDKEVTLGKKLA